MRSLVIIYMALGQLTASSATLSLFNIRYDHAGLTQITIACDTLTYLTHSLKTDPVAYRQDLSSYDRHKTVAQLTNEDRRSLLTWIQANDWKLMAKTYTSGEPGSYGAAFRSTIDIKLNGIRYQASWDDTSHCPDIMKAVKELEEICRQIVGRKKTTNAEPKRGHKHL